LLDLRLHILLLGRMVLRLSVRVLHRLLWLVDWLLGLHLRLLWLVHWLLGLHLRLLWRVHRLGLLTRKRK
jgi:hypothetical protein